MPAQATRPANAPSAHPAPVHPTTGTHPDTIAIPYRLWEIIQDWPPLIQKTRMQATFLCPLRLYEAAVEAVPLWDAVFAQHPVALRED